MRPIKYQVAHSLCIAMRNSRTFVTVARKKPLNNRKSFKKFDRQMGRHFEN